MKNEIPWRVMRVDDDAPVERIDRWLGQRLTDISRRQIARLVEDRRVVVDGRPARKGDPARPGADVWILDEPTPRRWAPAADANLPLCVVYEDDALLAVAKPAGIASVPLDHRELGTLAGAVVAKYAECLDLGRRNGDGGLIQRLDRETSGIVLVARSRDVLDALLQAQRAGRIEKSYLALVGGDGGVPAVIDNPLVPEGAGRRRMRAAAVGEPAQTRLRVVLRTPSGMLVEAIIHSGVRHQIRAHLAHLGYPIAGDVLYGGPRLVGLERLFLHAHRIVLEHPLTHKPLDISAPLPSELESHLI